MSTELMRTDNFSLTRYYGGEEKGVCYQLTSNALASGYIQLTETEMLQLLSIANKEIPYAG